MGNKKLWGGLILTFLVLVLVGSLFFGGGTGGNFSSKGVIAVIDIEGTIVGERAAGYFSAGADSPTIMEEIRAAKDDPAVRAVILRINSPGGSAAASQEITREIIRLKENGKTVVAYMGDTAASGGYWVAALADKIVANPATLTGSIGVIMQTTDVEILMDNLGIKYDVFKSGPHKDMGSPFRSATESEEAIFQAMIDDIYSQFVEVVAEGRGLPRETVLALADGRVFTGSQAKKAGLVDELGNFYDAVNLTKDLSGIEGEALLRTYKKRGSFVNLLGTNSPLHFFNEFKGMDPGSIKIR